MPLSDVQARLTFSKMDTNAQDSSEMQQDPLEQSETNKAVPDDSTSSEDYHIVLVPPSEYILGVADLTGEMMRRAINSVSAGDFDRPFEICKFLQDIEAAYASLGNANREVYRKLHTLRQSLRKVEAACYTLKVRGSEVPKHMLIDMISKPNISQLNVDDNGVLDDD